MRLEQVDLRSRSFLLQFFEVMSEFGNIIPWLEYLKTIKYSTNAEYFRDQVLKLLRCQDEHDILPYQLIGNKPERDFFGSIIHFKKSPERFRDFKNIEIMEGLEQQGYDYITCLQIRGQYRRQGWASVLLNGVMKKIIDQRQSVWAVLSDYNKDLYPYLSGATLRSPENNLDKLWIITWDRKN